MAITERSRHQMIIALKQALGEEAAMTLTEHLPPGGPVDLATHQDIVLLRQEMDQRFAQVDQRFAQIDQRFAQIDLRLDGVEQRLSGVDVGLDQKLENFELRMLSKLDQRFEAQTRSIMVAFVTSLIGFGGLMLGAVALAH